jgi:hypothetical protein
MHYILRQSTASQEVHFPAILSATDLSAQTALSIANTDVKISKAGSTAEANKNSGGATHKAAGRYYCVLDAADTDTIGSGRIDIAMSGTLPVGVGFTVLAAAVYDVLFGTTAPSTFAGGAVASVTGNVGGNVTGSVGSVVASVAVASLAANSVTASALAADAVTEIQSGLATAANLATVAGYLDTEIVAILEDTGTTIPAQIAARTLAAADYATAAAVGDVPTNAELATALAAADDAVLAAVAALSVPTASANAAAVWAAAIRTLTSAGAGGATAQEVWEYASRTLTPDDPAMAKVLAAVYDSAAVSGSTITLSTGATQVVSAAGRVTTEP